MNTQQLTERVFQQANGLVDDLGFVHFSFQVIERGGWIMLKLVPDATGPYAKGPEFEISSTGTGNPSERVTFRDLFKALKEIGNSHIRELNHRAATATYEERMRKQEQGR